MATHSSHRLASVTWGSAERSLIVRKCTNHDTRGRKSSTFRAFPTNAQQVQVPVRSSRVGSKDLDLGSLSLAIASITIRDAEAACLLRILAIAKFRY